MPIVKHIAVHTTPKINIEYICNGDKTDELKYVSGINCPIDSGQAYDFFRRTFERFTGERFYKKSLDENSKKEKIRLHHYIQSFSPEENITPEEAHEIGKEWAKKVFGDDFQIIVSTHIDKNHIHNHFAVSPYSLYGEKWNGNFTTLKRCRKISDEISIEHGIDIIENPKNKNTMKYNEWLACQSGISWKQNIRNVIDKAISSAEVNSLDDLIERLKEKGYDVKKGKYLTIKEKNMERGIRTIRLGDGYSVPELQYRIQFKDREISDVAISKLNGEAKAYAIYLREMQIQVRYRRNSTKVTYKDLMNSSNLLTYIVKNNITSEDDFAQRLNDLNDRYRDVYNECRSVRNRLLKAEEPDEKMNLQNKLDGLGVKEQDLKNKRKEVTQLYKTFLKHKSDENYKSIEELPSEHENSQSIPISENYVL
ncbi:MAG: relaxase/mobilization nuclease domain-containing protein [Oscillospiraceae bacterium]|nr:relaxase/mobilization nuclease domain-containing protein [Oscillospiraceae bacterium]